MKNHLLQIGSSDLVEIEKLYGPLIMCDLRVSVDSIRGEWIIERLIHHKDGNEEWEVCSRIDGQNSIEFEK